MKVHFIQNGLSDFHSHYFQETLAWKIAFEQANLDWIAYANLALSAPLQQLLAVKACFRYAPDSIADSDPVSREITDLLHLSEAFAEGCAEILRTGLSPEDVLVLGYASHVDLYGVARFLQTIPPARRPRVAFMFHTPDFSWVVSGDRASVQGNYASWRFAANQLKALVPMNRIHAYALDKRLASCLTGVLGLPTRPMPLVVLFAERAVREAAETGEKRYDVIIPGHFRAEKGGQFFVEILRAITRTNASLSVALQVGTDAQARELREAISGSAVAALIDIAVGDLSHNDYLDRLVRSRMVLLPYVPARYAWRGSGVATESFGYGLPVVAPADTWISDRLEENAGAGLVFREWNPAAIAAAVGAAHTALDELTRQAHARAPAWREKHHAGAALRQLLDDLAIAS